jgi:hypothetical protein
MTAPGRYHDTPLMLAAWFQSLPLADMAVILRPNQTRVEGLPRKMPIDVTSDQLGVQMILGKW